MSLASTVNQQSTATAATAASTTASSSPNALTSLSSNFQDFLSLLMTQLQNQDPTSPMDTNSFTTELVQFSAVEQQISTNGSLTQLIQLTQSGQILQSASLVGHQVDVTSNQLSLQSGAAGVKFTTTASEPVTITVSDANGGVLKSANVTSVAGSNTWNWDGTSDSGVQLPDGAYSVAVTTSSGGTSTAVPFTVTATATGVQSNSGTLDVGLGSLNVPFSNITSLDN